VIVIEYSNETALLDLSSVETPLKVIDGIQTPSTVFKREDGKYQALIDFSRVQTDAIHRGRPRSSIDGVHTPSNAVNDTTTFERRAPLLHACVCGGSFKKSSIARFQ